jgi:hypothetical protein
MAYAARARPVAVALGAGNQVALCGQHTNHDQDDDDERGGQRGDVSRHRDSLSLYISI